MPGSEGERGPSAAASRHPSGAFRELRRFLRVRRRLLRQIAKSEEDETRHLCVRVCFVVPSHEILASWCQSRIGLFVLLSRIAHKRVQTSRF